MRLRARPTSLRLRVIRGGSHTPSCASPNCPESTSLGPGGDEDGTASRVAKKRGRRETFDRKDLAVPFEKLTESRRRFVSLFKCVTRVSAQETYVRRCGSHRSCVDPFHRFDRR